MFAVVFSPFEPRIAKSELYFRGGIFKNHFEPRIAKSELYFRGGIFKIPF